MWRKAERERKRINCERFAVRNGECNMKQRKKKGKVKGRGGGEEMSEESLSPPRRHTQEKVLSY